MLRDLATLVARATVGLAFASHGAQKAFGWFGGPGAAGAAGFLESLGFKPGAKYATLTSYTEMASGICLAAGFGGPAAPAAMIGVMLVAQMTVHAKNGFYAQKGGVELGVVYAAAAVALAASGYGRLSLDALSGLDEPLDNDALVAAALAAGAIGGLLALSRRETPSGDA